MSRSVFRKPSVKKSLSAKYKGKYTRAAKKAINPMYGTSTSGWLNPERKLYNKVYDKTSIDTRKVIAGSLPNRNDGNARISNSYVPINDPFLDASSGLEETVELSTNVDNGKDTLGSFIYDATLIIINGCLWGTGHIWWGLLFFVWVIFRAVRNRLNWEN